MKSNTTTIQDEEFKKHQENELFGDINFLSLYKFFNKTKYENYFIFTNLKFAKLYNDEHVFYFYHKLFTFILKENDRELINKKITSTYEIFKSLQKYDKEKIFFNSKVYNKNKDYINEVKESNTLVFNLITEKITVFKGNNFMEVFKEGKLSKFPENWNLYFKTKEDNIIYYDSEARATLDSILFNLKYNNEKFYFFKITGPIGIGKSFYLYKFAKTSKNTIYINMKALFDIFKKGQTIQMKNILIKEFNQMIIKKDEYAKNINEIFQDKLNNDLTSLLNSLISYILKTIVFENDKLLLIFDQYKTKYFSENSLSTIQDLVFQMKDSPIRFVICSSINDDLVRTSCIKFWAKLINEKDNYYYLKKEYQLLYHYIPKLLDISEIKNEKIKNIDGVLKLILEHFNYVPKYINKFVNCDKDNFESELNKTEANIIKKLKEFYTENFSIQGEENIISKLVSLKKYLNKSLPLMELKNISSEFSFKYFLFRFYSGDKEIFILFNDINKITSFQIDYCFTFIKDIFDTLTLENQNKFFNDYDYINHTGSTIGGFFEISAIQGLKNSNILPKSTKNTLNIRVKKINEMCKYVPIIKDEVKNDIHLMSNEKKEENKNIIKEECYNPIPKNEDDNFFNLLNGDGKATYNKYGYKENKIEEIYEQITRDNKIFIYDENEELIAYSKYDKNLKKNKIFKVEKNSNNNENKNKKGNQIIIDEEKGEYNIIKKIIIENKNNYLHQFKNNSIYISQSFENAPIFDFGYLYGDYDNKIFLGFQMKAYNDNNNLSININKNNIIDNSKFLLLNSKYFLNVNIKEWHFYIVGLYFNEKNKAEANQIKTYSNNLIKYCKKNNIAIILYDPVTQIFYNSNKSKIINFLIPNELSSITPYFFYNDKIKKIMPSYLCKKTKRTINEEYKNFYLKIINKTELNEDDIKKYSINCEFFFNNIKKKYNINEIFYVDEIPLEGNIFPISDEPNSFVLFFKKNKNRKKKKSYFLIILTNEDGKIFYNSSESNLCLLKNNEILSLTVKIDMKKNCYLFKYN